VLYDVEKDQRKSALEKAMGKKRDEDEYIRNMGLDPNKLKDLMANPDLGAMEEKFREVQASMGLDTTKEPTADEMAVPPRPAPPARPTRRPGCLPPARCSAGARLLR